MIEFVLPIIIVVAIIIRTDMKYKGEKTNFVIFMGIIIILISYIVGYQNYHNF